MDYSITGKSFVRLAGSTAVIAITGLLCLTWNSKSNPPEAVKVSVLADSVGMIVSVALDPQSGTLYAILEGDRELHAYSSRLPTTNPWRRAAARTADVPKTSDEVRLPGALAVDGAGNLYTVDHGGSYGDRGHSFIRKRGRDGAETVLPYVTGMVEHAHVKTPLLFQSLTSIAVDNSGNVFASDANASTIYKISNGTTISKVAGPFGRNGSISDITFIEGIAGDGRGGIVVADNANAIYRISAGGTTTLVAGKPEECGAVDGVGADARFCSPNAIAVSKKGIIFVLDADCSVRRIGLDGNVSTVASSDQGRKPANVRIPARHCPLLSIATGQEDELYVGGRSNPPKLAVGVHFSKLLSMFSQ